jgi:uncharacterized membrane protein YhiD involved in acid resistance
MQYTHIFTDPSLTTLFQLIVACVLGGALGLERSIHHKPVGFKSCLIATSCVALSMFLPRGRVGADDSEQLAVAVVWLYYYTSWLNP